MENTPGTIQPKHSLDTQVTSTEQSIYQLIKLHKRFEQDAVRNRRNGYVSPEVDTLNMKTASEGRVTTEKLKHSHFLKRNSHVDDDYFQELLRAQLSEKEDELNLKKEQFALKLPKLPNISPENKAIFYTALPSVPSIKGSDVKRYQSQKQKLRNQFFYGVNSFIKIRPLLGDDDVNRDVQAISKVTESNCMTGYGVLPTIGVKESLQQSDCTVTQSLKTSSFTTPRKFDAVTQSQSPNRAAELFTELDKDNVTQSRHKANNNSAPLKLNGNTVSRKLDSVTKSPQKLKHVPLSGYSSLRKSSAKSCKSRTRNDHQINDDMKSMGFSHGVTKVKVTVVTQQQSHLLNKNRFKHVGKTPLNSPRDRSLMSHKLGCNVDYEGKDGECGNILPTSSKSERNVHFSQHLTEIHRYSSLSPAF